MECAGLLSEFASMSWQGVVLTLGLGALFVWFVK